MRRAAKIKMTNEAGMSLKINVIESNGAPIPVLKKWKQFATRKAEFETRKPILSSYGKPRSARPLEAVAAVSDRLVDRRSTLQIMSRRIEQGLACRRQCKARQFFAGC